MALQNLSLVEQSTYPSLQITCQRGGSVIPLTDASSVDLIISLKRMQTNSGHTACTISDAAHGVITYQQQSSDFPTAGNYYCDVHITYNGGGSETLEDVLVVTARPRTNSLT